MRKLLAISLLILLTGSISCQKEVIEPINEVVEPLETLSVFGEWVLVGGNMYIENLETNVKTVYSHFDDNKSVSSLRLEGNMFNIERIVKDSTVWTFIAPPNIPNYGEFWLNNDSLQPYGFYLTTSNMSIVENNTGDQQLGGSSRPLSAYLNGVPNQATFYIQEIYSSIGGENVKYFSELTFEKQ